MSEKKKYLLRIDETLFEVLEKWAADELRSVNSQIEYLLSECVKKAGRKAGVRQPPGQQGKTNAFDTPNGI